MRVLIALSLLVLVLGQPVHENDSARAIEKRDAENAVHSVEKRAAHGSGDDANQDVDQDQVAYDSKGSVARQGPGGQSVFASDFGGPIVQILQNLYKKGCCLPGATCPCNDKKA